MLFFFSFAFKIGEMRVSESGLKGVVSCQPVVHALTKSTKMCSPVIIVAVSVEGGHKKAEGNVFHSE